METLENEIEDIDKKLEALAEEETGSNPIVNAVIVQAANLMGIHHGGTKLCDKSKAGKSNMAEPGDLSVSDSSDTSDIEMSNGRKDDSNVDDVIASSEGGNEDNDEVDSDDVFN